MAIIPRFSDQTEQVILARMLNDISNEVDKRQGSVAYDMTDPAAQEFAQAYIALDNTLGFAFINEDMPSDLLTLAAYDFGVDRKPAIHANGNILITGTIGQFIPKNTQVRTDNGVYFYIMEDVTLTQTTQVAPVVAVEGGTSGNVGIGEIDTVVGDLAGVITVTNTAAFDNGVDEESDEALLQRVYDKVRKPATSGNVYHYEQWAKEVAGVSDARVYPIWNGPGTVKVVLLGDNKQAPPQSVIDATLAHINEEAPVGADVTVVGATDFLININADLTLATGATIDEVKAQIETAVASYLESLAFKDDLVRYTQIAAILLADSRIIDYSNLLVNGGTANIEVTGDQVAVLGAVDVNAV